MNILDLVLFIIIFFTLDAAISTTDEDPTNFIGPPPRPPPTMNSKKYDGRIDKQTDEYGFEAKINTV